MSQLSFGCGIQYRTSKERGRMTYKKLISKFPENRLLRFVSTRKDCQLSLKERWVYSTLLWRYKGRPVSKARLSQWTGVDRTRTLPRILSRLSNLRLVVTADKKFKAVEPPNDLMPWFATHVRGFGESERLVPSYNWAVYVPSRDIIDNLVACADAIGRHAAAKLARRFGVCAKTITAARRRLKANPQETESAPASKLETVPVKEMPAIPVTVEAVVSVKPVTTVQPVAMAGYEQPPAKPSSKAQQLAAQHCGFLDVEPDAAKEIARLCELLKGLGPKELGQIVSALVQKYGKGDGLEDAVHWLIQRRYHDYLYGTTMEKVMAHIGTRCSAHEDDDDFDLDLSMFGDEEEELATNE